MPVKERHRTTLACARCYQLKKKCDKKAPSCSRCIQARQPCIGINRQKDIEIPRSVVQYLEEVLKKLESSRNAGPPVVVAAGRGDHGFQLESPQNASVAGFQDHYPYIIEGTQRAVASICTTTLLEGQLRLYHRNRLFYGSEPPPLKIDIGPHQDEPYRITGGLSTPRAPNLDLLLVPAEVAALLLNVYIENILPRYPCFLELELKQHFEAVYSAPSFGQENGPLSEMSRFLVVMVLAISTLTSKAHPFRKVASLSEALHRDALRHSQFLRQSNINTLRCLLLLIQFTLLLPHTGNLWYMTGEAMRIAIALGLHQEPVEPLDFRLLDLRRSIFWTTYILERAVTITSGCPLALGDEYINVALPSRYGIGPNGVDFDQPHCRKKNLFLNIIQLRQLQTEIHAVRFFGHQLPDLALDYNDWVEAMGTRIQKWQDHALSGQELAPDWFTNAARVTRLMLHRPCSRNTTLSDPSISEVVKSATDVVNGCWKLSETGYLVYPFHNVYNGFHAGLVMLYAMKHHTEICHSWNLYGQVVEALNLLDQMFSRLSERWPAAIGTGRYFNELKEGVLRNIDPTSEPGSSLEDINLIAELDHLVTDRRIQDIYQRSSTITTIQAAETTSSPDWMFPLGTDETWEDFMNIGFGFDNLESFYIPDGVDSFASPAPAMTPVEPVSMLSEAIDEPISIAKLESVVESIPACNYCRNRRVKCDRALPTCWTCANSGKSCLIYDSILLTDIPGSYLQTLYINIRNKISQGTTGEAVLPNHSVTPAFAAVESTPGMARNIFIPNGERTCITVPYGLGKDQDLSAIDKAFFGLSSSATALDLTMSTRPCSTQPQGPAHGGLRSIIPTAADDRLLQQLSLLPAYPIAKALIHLFSQSINIFYPTIQQDDLEKLLLTAYEEPENICGSFEEQTFYIILGIASHLTRGNDPSLVCTSSAYFRKGTSDDSIMHKRTSTSQVLLLQRTLLTCIYLLLSPGSGDLWRNLGFAVRLYFDMVHRPSGDEHEQGLAVMLYRTLYCLESQVAIAYGRPSLLAFCDVLRINMLTTVSDTPAERISMHSYRISFLKLQILNKALASPSSISLPSSSAHDPSQNLRQDLHTWHEEWSRDLSQFSIILEDGIHDSSLAQLKAWGQLAYYETLLLSSRTEIVSPSSFREEDNHQICARFIRACTALTRAQAISSRLVFVDSSENQIGTQPSRLPFLFPLTWTTTHAVFAAAVSLFQTHISCGATAAATAENNMNQTLLRKCVTLLAALEANPHNLAAGFTEILEGFCGKEEEEG